MKERVWDRRPCRAAGCISQPRGQSHGRRKEAGVSPSLQKTQHCAAQPTKEAVFCFVLLSESALGAVEDTQQTSRKDRLLRKTYLGVWRCESILITAMRLRFQARVGR